MFFDLQKVWDKVHRSYHIKIKIYFKGTIIYFLILKNRRLNLNFWMEKLYCVFFSLVKLVKNPQFNFSIQNLSIECNSFKWDGKTCLVVTSRYNVVDWLFTVLQRSPNHDIHDYEIMRWRIFKFGIYPKLVFFSDDFIITNLWGRAGRGSFLCWNCTKTRARYYLIFSDFG